MELAISQKIMKRESAFNKSVDILQVYFETFPKRLLLLTEYFYFNYKNGHVNGCTKNN